ncbi:hypothetical protein BE17_22505, partial [Sorangium cellulosum]
GTGQNLERFLKPGLIGGVVGGVLSGLPLVNLLNCCFCLLNVAGAAVAVSLYLNEHPHERLSGNDAALCGAIAGAAAGLIAGVFDLVIKVLFGTLLGGLYASLPPDLVKNLAIGSLATAIYIPFYAIAYSAMGALGGFLSLQLLFKDRLAS